MCSPAPVENSLVAERGYRRAIPSAAGKRTTLRTDYVHTIGRTRPAAPLSKRALALAEHRSLPFSKAPASKRPKNAEAALSNAGHSKSRNGPIALNSEAALSNAGHSESRNGPIAPNAEAALSNAGHSKKGDEPSDSESDGDILKLREEVHLELLPTISRGQLLRRTTLKPPAPETQSERSADQVPPNSVSTVKRIVRVRETYTAKAVGVSASTQTPARPKYASVGVQAGSPVFLPAPAVQQPVVANTSATRSGAEPPLIAFHTHQLNLPFPPARDYAQQQAINQFILELLSAHQQRQQQQEQEQQLQQLTLLHASLGQLLQGNPPAPAPPHQQPQLVTDQVAASGRAYNSKNRRNFIKKQKLLERIGRRNHPF